MKQYFHLVASSQNEKLGPMPTSYGSKSTCPDTCPLKKAGCYAKNGPINVTWQKVSDGLRGKEWGGFLEDVKALRAGTLWRYGTAGDLPGIGNDIDVKKLHELTTANRGKVGFTYTHKYGSLKNIKAIQQANKNGLVVNLSTNSLEHADSLAHHGIPLTALVPLNTPKTFETPGGLPGIVCPAQTMDSMTCYRCGYCAKRDRQKIVGFRPHGSQVKAAIAAMESSK